MNQKVIYLSGPITGHKNYKAAFAAAEKYLTDFGAVVINPAVLPEGVGDHDAYMRITLAMQAEAEAVAFLPEWLGSKGARMEHIRAIELEQPCYELDFDAIGDSEIVCVGHQFMPSLSEVPVQSADLVALHQVLERSRRVWGTPNVS